MRKAAGVLATLMLASVLSGASSAAAAAKPDLVVGSLSVPLDPTWVGAEIEVSIATKNVGRGAAPASVTGLYLSSDRKRSSSDSPLGAGASVPKLKARKSAPQIVEITIPETAAGASFFVLACADAKKKVRETKETNNCRATKSPLDVAGPSSEELIDEDLAAGKITEEEALSYEVFADFGDERLPAKYEGDDPAGGGHVLNELASVYETLSPETQEIVGPYLVAPFEPGSWYEKNNLDTEPTSRLKARGELRPCDDFGGREGARYALWNSLDAVEGRVRIWWPEVADSFSQPIAQYVKTELERAIWPKMTALMGREPLPDGGATGICRGGTDALDITLLDLPGGRWMSGMLAEGGQPLCSGLPARILVNVTDYADRKRFDQLLAHETFHALQYSFKTQDCLKAGSPAMWWLEGTAQWFEDQVYPGHNTEHAFAERILNSPEVPLNDPANEERFYGTYLFPFFLTRSGKPFAVRQIWEAMVGSPMMTALTAPFSSTKDFDDSWKKFTLLNYNREPVTDYQSWDKLTKKANVTTAPLKVQKVPLELELDHLSAQYLTLEIADDVTTVKIKNPFAGNANVSMQAVLEYADGRKEVVDWSAKETIEFCRDRKDQNVSKITIIVANSATAGTATGTIELEGTKDSCLCDVATQSRRSVELRQADCGGGITITVTDQWRQGGSNGDYSAMESEYTATVNLKLKRYEGDSDSYEDAGSTYTYSRTDHFSGSRNDCGQTQETTYSGAGLLDGGISASRDFESDGLWLFGPYPRASASVSGQTCHGSYSYTTSEDETPIFLHSCPLENTHFGTSHLFPLVSDADGTKTYSLNCSDTQPWPADSGREGTVTITTTGTITLRNGEITSE